MKTARAFLSALIGLLLLIVLSACDSRQEITDAGSLTLPETVRTEAQTAATEAITSGQEQPDPEPEPDLCLYTGDTRIFSLKGGEHAGILPSHISLVRVINELENVSVAALYYEIGGSVFKADGDEKTGYGVSVPDGQTASLTPVLEIDGKTVVYCASSGALAMISGDYGFSGCEVFLTSDIEVETDLEISVPFTLDTNGCVLKADTLVFVSSGPGEMTLRGKNGGIECSEVVCDAPEWDFCIDCILPEFEEEEHLFIDARSVNGREIDLTRLTFSSADEVNAFSDSDGVLNINDVVKTLVFSGEYDLPGQTLSRPAALVFKGTVGIPGAFTIGTVNEGEISVDTEGNSIPLLGHIKIDAPFSRLVWSGNDAPDISFAEQYINVAEYNGITLDKNAGGNNPDRLISCALDGLEGYIDGYYVTFEMPYNIMAFSEKSVLSAVSSGLSRSYLKSEGGNYYIVLEDGDKTTGYKVFCTARAYFLPRIYINTEDSKSVSSKEEYVNCEVTLDYN